MAELYKKKNIHGVAIQRHILTKAVSLITGLGCILQTVDKSC